MRRHTQSARDTARQGFAEVIRPAAPVAIEVRTIDESLNLRHAELLARVDIFARLGRVALARLAAHIEPRAVEAGTAVCREGEAGDSLYIVVRGHFGVYATPPDGAGEARLNTLTAGDCFGEMALLTQEPRSATVRAEDDGQVLELEHDRFVELIRQEPAIGLAIAATLSRRLKAASHEIARTNHVILAAVEQELLHLSPERRASCLQAGLLDEVSPAALRAMFGPRAAEVAADLATLGITPDAPSQPSLAALRAIHEREQGPGRAETLDRAVALRLADAGCWEAALGVLARQTDRASFAAVLGRALRAIPPLAAERGQRWVEHLTDDEAASDPSLTLARVALYDARGHPSLVQAVLQKGLSAAISTGDAGAGRLLSAELARRVGADGLPPPTGLGHRLVALWPRVVPNVGKLRRPAVPAFAAVCVAVGLIVLAAGLRGNAQWAFVLLLLAAIVLWVSDVLADFVVSLALVAGWLALDIARPSEALGGFATSNWLFTFGVIAISAAIAESGLLFRAGLLLIRRMPSGLFLQAGTLLVTGLVLSPLLPQNAGRAALLSPIALAVAEAAKLKDREPAAAVLGLAAWIGSTPLMFWFLNGSSLCLLGWGLLPEAQRAQFGWIQWFVAAAPLGIFVSIGALVMLFVLLRPRRLPPPERERVAVQIAVLGSPTGREYAMIAVLALTVVGFALSPKLGLDVGVVPILGLLAAVVTGNFDRRSLQNLDWNFLIFNGVALSIAGLTVGLGLDKVAAAVIGERLGMIASTPVAFVLAVAVTNLLVRLVLSQNQAILLMGLSLLPVASDVGVNPWIVIITLLSTSVMWFLPNQTNSYLIALSASEERLFSPAQGRLVAFGYSAVTLAGLAVVSLTAWHLMGLL